MIPGFRGVGQDVRVGIRSLSSARAVSLAAILSLAIGIGALTAIFSLIDTLLLRKLPVVEPERLVTVASEFAISRGFKAGAGWNFVMWERLESRASLFDGAFAWCSRELTLGRGGDTAPVTAVYASGAFFSTLGVPALHGRVLTPADDVSGGGAAGPVAVISYGLWQRRFGGSREAIGAPLVIEGVPFTIVGVAPPEFLGVEVGQAFDVVLPLRSETLIRGSHAAMLQPRNYFLIVMLRLKRGQTLQSATATMRSLESEIVPANAPSFVKPFALAAAAEGTSNPSAGAGGLRMRFQRPLLIILAVAAFVLLIACVNIANLLLARAVARRHEFGVRVALGATRWRLARQLLVESVVLAAAGAIAGLGLAMWGGRMLVSQLSTPLNRIVLPLSLDWQVLLFTTAVTAATAAIFGIIPASGARRADAMEALKGGSRSASSSRSPSVAGTLVVAQVALSLLLLVVAVLLGRTFTRLASVPLGFDSDRVLVVRVDAVRTEINEASRPAFVDRLIDSVATLPDVEGAAGSMWTPLSGAGAMLGVTVAGAPPEAEHGVVANFITPGWFSAYGMRLREGRDFERHDSNASAPVVIVNEAFLRRFALDRRALGTVVRFDSSHERTIVGIVGDAVFRSGRMIPGVASLALRDDVPPTVFVPMAQAAGLTPPDSTIVHLSLRSERQSPTALAPSIAAALAGVGPDLTFAFRPLRDYVNAALAQERLLAILSGFFGGAGLLLSAVGIYGVTSYAVNLRRKEIGIRLALGAAPRGIVLLVFRRLTITIGAGVVAGAIASLWGSRWVAALLYGVDPHNRAAFLAAAAALAVVGAVAGALPAVGASRTDPAVVLRSE